jgi:hypothetical protein
LADWNEPRLVYRRGRRPKGLVLKNRRLDRSSFQYKNFPQTIHGRAVLTYNVENKVVQKVLTRILREFNKLQLDTSISLADREGYFDGQIVFEVGVANENYFKYLDSYEERLINETIAKQGVLSIFDFLIVARYVVKDHDRHPVRMDSYLVRFIASEYSMELYLSHERGIRRLNPDELIMMIAKELDHQLKIGYNTSLKMESLRTA